MNTKRIGFKISTQILLVIAFIGYFVSLYRGIASNISTYTNFILIIICLSGVLYAKPEKENRALYILTWLNCFIFIAWVIALVAQLIM